MNVYEYLASKLLKEDLSRREIYIDLKSFGKGSWFGFKYRGYDGIMAKPRYGQNYVERSKEGYFDIFICTGNRYLNRNGLKQVTHYNLFLDLLENSSLESCIKIWRGDFPEDVAKDIEEEQALCTLTLLMFEQELNWGNESWQRYTNFYPVFDGIYQRPRDMIMGFVHMLFSLNNIESIPNWRHKIINELSVKTTPTFGQAGYKYYPIEYKKYFEVLKKYDIAKPLMQGNILQMFRNKVSEAPDNRFYRNPILQ